MQKLTRLKRELELLQKNPPDGIMCYMVDNKIDHLQVDIIGPPSTAYEEGVFKLEVKVSDKYPFEPPAIKFLTKVYHPNIDTEGLICLDLLKMPPMGNWKPNAGLVGLLVAIRELLKYPNSEDPLMADIADEYQNKRDVFEKTAREQTKKYAA